MRRLFLLVSLSSFLLFACSGENVTPKATIEETPEQDVQQVVDATDLSVYASMLYNQSSDSFLIVNSVNTPRISVEEVGNDLNIHLDDPITTGEPKSTVFRLQINSGYDTIHIFRNDEEIDFDIWYGQ